MFDVSALRERQRTRLQTPTAGLFFEHCIFRCIHSALPVFFTRILKTARVCLCVCTCKHSAPQQKQSKVIKTVSLAAPLQLLFEVTGGERRCPSVPHACLPAYLPTTTTTTTSRRRCYVCLSPCQMPGGWGFHALLGTGPRKSHSMQNTSLMFCVCACGTVCEWAGVWL